MTNPFSPYGGSDTDSLKEIFGLARKPEAPTGPGADVKARQFARQECREKGHRYQVHGKMDPTKVVCSRCEVSWKIGARTEPTYD